MSLTSISGYPWTGNSVSTGIQSVGTSRYCREYYEMACEYKDVYEIISTQQVTHMRSCAEKAKEIRSIIETENINSFPVIRGLHKSLDLAKELAAQILKDDYDRYYIDSKKVVEIEKYRYKDNKYTDLFLVTDDAKYPIRTIIQVKKIFEKANKGSSGKPVILADQDNNACIMLDSKEISKYIEHNINNLDGFIPNELTFKLNDEEYLMIKKDVYNKFREHIDRIHDYLEKADTIFEYCKSIIENIAHN